MWSKEALEHGLEWISGKTKITAKHTGGYWGMEGFIDVRLYPNYPNEQHSIHLMIQIAGDNLAVFIDLVGNGHESKLQDQGYGTLITNIGIQTLYTYYGLTPEDEKTKEIIIKGKTSDVGDPETEPERSLCRDRRNHFWRSHGLPPKDPEAFVTPLRGTLANLKIKSGKITANGTPADIKLKDFWKDGEAPALFQRDIDTLISLDIDQLDYDNCPTPEILNASENRYRETLSVIHGTCWAVLSVLIMYASFIYLGVANAIPISLAGAILSYVLALLLINHISSSLPSYRDYVNLWERRGNTIRGIKSYIQQLEEHHNGLLWRLHNGLINHDKSMRNEIYDRLSIESKKLYSHTIADNYDEYLSFVDKARTVVIRQNIKGHG